VHLRTGSDISYIERPAKQTPSRGTIVVLHGGPSFADEWFLHPTSKLTDSGFDVIQYDQVGAGDSERLADPNDYSIERHEKDLIALLDSLGKDKIILLGESWGARFAASFAAHHADRITALILVSPAPIDFHKYPNPMTVEARKRIAGGGDDAQQYFASGRYQAWEWLAKRNLALAHDFAGDKELDALLQLRATTQTTLHCKDGPEAVDQMEGIGFYGSYRVNNELNAVGDRDFDARKIKAPTLVMHGSCDPFVESIVNDYVREIDGATLITLEGAAHDPAFEVPSTYGQAVRHFLSSVAK
jgi:pimeloyl-ACP methyl ester carboxylesterase